MDRGERGTGMTESALSARLKLQVRPLGPRRFAKGESSGSLGGVPRMTESALPARLKLKVRPLGPWGRVWEGGPREAWARSAG